MLFYAALGLSNAATSAVFGQAEIDASGRHWH